jgi:hypothetical protein
MFDSARPALLTATSNALTDAEEYGLNDELVSSYFNIIVFPKLAADAPAYTGIISTTASYLGTDWLSAFSCQPSYTFMKGLNSEGTPKVIQFSVNYGTWAPRSSEYNYPD